MRKPRVIIFDDDVVIVKMLENFFMARGYEVSSYTEPVICPLYEKSADSCIKQEPCADVIITDFKMPKMNGLELLQGQTRRGCKLDIRNKVIISGYLDDQGLQKIRDLGCMFLQKPFTKSELSALLNECEKRFDLSQPLSLSELFDAP